MSNYSLTLPGQEALWRASFFETCSMQSEQDSWCLWISLHLPLIWKLELSCPYQWPPGAVPSALGLFPRLWDCSPGPGAVPTSSPGHYPSRDSAGLRPGLPRLSHGQLRPCTWKGTAEITTQTHRTERILPEGLISHQLHNSFRTEQ